MTGLNDCFLTCIQVSPKAGKVVWYSHFFKNFPQFVVIPDSSVGKESACNAGDLIQFLGQEDLLEKGQATYSSILGILFHFHRVKRFSIVNEAEVDVFLEFSCFIYDPTDVDN